MLGVPALSPYTFSTNITIRLNMINNHANMAIELLQLLPHRSVRRSVAVSDMIYPEEVCYEEVPRTASLSTERWSHVAHAALVHGVEIVHVKGRVWVHAGMTRRTRCCLVDVDDDVVIITVITALLRGARLVRTRLVQQAGKEINPCVIADEMNNPMSFESLSNPAVLVDAAASKVVPSIHKRGQGPGGERLQTLHRNCGGVRDKLENAAACK